MSRFLANEIEKLEQMVYPKVTLTSIANGTYTATKGNETVSGTLNSQGVGDIYLPEIGTWNITVIGSSGARTGQITVSSVGGTSSLSIEYATLTVTSDIGNTITATNGDYSVSGTIGAGGTVDLTIGTGTWVINSGNGTVSVSDSVTINAEDSSASKSLTLPTITVTTAEGASVSAVKDGITVSGTADSNGECVLKVSVGTWEVSATSDGETNTENVVVSAHSTNVNVSIVSLTAWQIIQQKVRNGTAATEYPVGSQLQVTKGSSTLTFDVVAHDVATPADTSKTHSMTLVLHDMLPDHMPFDAPEPNNSDSNRRSYGNNRYSVSNIRQWLNSSGTANNWYTTQHTADAAPSYANQNGFMYDIDSEFLEVIGDTKIKVALNTVTDGGGYEEVTDKFYLPSSTEVGFTNENNIAEGVLFPYFSDNNSRIKIYNGSEDYWWLRTPYSSISNYVRFVIDDGRRSYSNADSDNIGVAPACNII